jgi:glycerol-3-phosphate dehydrogenase (NAD(P)+)
MRQIAVLKPGAWGTTLGVLLSKRNIVNFWYENKKLATKIDKWRENERLPGIKIPSKIFISSDLRKTITNADLIIVASPSFSFRKTLLQLKKCWTQNLGNFPPLLGVAKGIEKKSLKLPSQVVEETFGKILYAHLSGPGFAREIIRGKTAEEVIASQNKSLLKKLKKLFAIKPLKISTTTDLIGVQLAGALKNALAISISLVKASIPKKGSQEIQKKLIQLSLQEMIKIGEVMGAKRKTFLGPAGLGDLILTSTSPLSRNFQFSRAILLDHQKIRKEIKEGKVTVEGFHNVFALHKLGDIYKLDLPMINELYKVIYQKAVPEKTVENLIKFTEKI